MPKIGVKEIFRKGGPYDKMLDHVLPRGGVTDRTVYVGIDPGVSGGMAEIWWDGNTRVQPMPETERDIWHWFDCFGGSEIRTYSVRAIIEKVHSMPKQGVASSFTFGRGYGFLRGCLTAAGIPFEEVSPQEWMKSLKIPPRKGCGNARQGKNRLRGIAQQLYPDLLLWKEPKSVGKQLAVADALLIATYCKRKHEGSL